MSVHEHDETQVIIVIDPTPSTHSMYVIIIISPEGVGWVNRKMENVKIQNTSQFKEE